MRKLLVLAILGVLNSCSVKKKVDTIWLVPENYIGTIGVFYDYPNGSPKEFEEDKRVYRIPENGVLKTSFSSDIWVSNIEVFYVMKDGKRKKIPNYSVDDTEFNSNNPYYIGSANPTGTSTTSYDDKICVIHKNSRIAIVTGNTYLKENNPHTYSLEETPFECKNK